MTTSDVLASGALLLSLGTLYLQFLHARDIIICSLINYRISDATLALDVSISNPGTRPILLTKANLCLMFMSKGGGGIGFAMTDPSATKRSQTIPRDGIGVCTVEMRIDGDAIEKAEDYFQNADHIHTGKYWPIWIELHFVTVSGKKLKIREVALEAKLKKNGGFGANVPTDKMWRTGDDFVEDRSLIV